MTLTETNTCSSLALWNTYNKLEGSYVITQVDEEGAPIAPYEASIKIIDWCGVIVRYKVPIIIWNWNPCNKDDQHAMPASDEEVFWRELKGILTLPEGVKEKVMQFALMNMMINFWIFKKKLY